MPGLIVALTVVTGIGAAVSTGVFFAFSVLVMPGLAKVAPADGAAAMRAINACAPRPVFLVPLLGTGVLGLVAAGWAVGNLGTPSAGWLLAGGLVYLLGPIGLTIGFNVPRNERLDRMSPGSTELVDYWRTYLRSWAAGNHVRGLTALAAAALFALALVLR